METYSVIEGFDVSEDGLDGLSPLGPGAKEFSFESAPEGLHGGIVVAIGFTAHAGEDAMGTQEGLVSGAGILNAAIGVVEQTRPGLAIAASLLEGVLDEGTFEAVLSRPANDLSAFKVHDGGQVKPAFAGGNVGDIGDPDLVEPGGSWTVVEQICSDGKGVSALGGFRTEAAFLDRSELM